jgi:hypothetical protein
MAGILRGEIRWADLNPVRGREQGGSRPIAIISENIFSRFRLECGYPLQVVVGAVSRTFFTPHRSPNGDRDRVLRSESRSPFCSGRGYGNHRPFPSPSESYY